ncbi:MAG: helix-turn-helix domain-containing protein [Parvularculaceae bacterium]|jgi:transcriptional regulator with XRE-family HTH domain|nr:helix-turn-helix domain-containing protein [Parvularculaceae bacterium]
MPELERLPVLTSIGERIRQARKAKGLNQAELALRLGVSQPTVANWEAGVHDPRRLMLAKLAEALGTSLEYLAQGARSQIERDKTAGAAYLRRAIRHAPVISFADAVRMLDDPLADPHAVAEDYIPVTTNAERVFALFLDDEAVDLAFPKDTLVVIDYADRHPADGAFCLAAPHRQAILRRWRESPARLEPHSSNPAHRPLAVVGDPRIIGCARVSIRVH